MLFDNWYPLHHSRLLSLLFCSLSPANPYRRSRFPFQQVLSLQECSPPREPYLIHFLIVALICVSLMEDYEKHLFMSLLPSVYSLTVKCLFVFFGPFSNWHVCLLSIEFWEFFVYSRGKSFVGCVICKYLLPAYCSLYSLNRVFRVKVLILMRSSISDFPVK